LDRAHAVGLTDGIFKLILRRTRSRQIVLLLGAAAAMPTLYLTLEIPKNIINHAISAGQKIIEILCHASHRLRASVAKADLGRDPEWIEELPRRSRSRARHSNMP
jgi:hypothetical protein